MTDKFHSYDKENPNPSVREETYYMLVNNGLFLGKQKGYHKRKGDLLYIDQQVP